MIGFLRRKGSVFKNFLPKSKAFSHYYSIDFFSTEVFINFFIKSFFKANTVKENSKV